MGERLRHIISSRQFDLGFLIKLYKDTVTIQKLLETRQGMELLSSILPGHVVGEIFWQESSRTFHSFASAAGRLGAKVVSERGMKQKSGKWFLAFSSAVKDAYFEDEVRAWASFYDLLILRTAEEGLVGRAVEILEEFHYDIPVVNAGDGIGEHPTQTLLDCFALLYGLGLDIEKDWQKLSHYSAAFINDCKYSRTIHSLALVLGKIFKMPLIFIAPPGLEAPKTLLDELDRSQVNYTLTDSLCPASVYYVTRLQKEYFKNPQDFERYKKYFSITIQVADRFGVRVVMHPFPRSKKGGELPIWLPSDPSTHLISLDKDPRAVYFYQMRVGVPLRMALLKYLLNPYLELQSLKEEYLRRSFRVQCAVCKRLESPELGWSEKAISYIPTLPHVLCPQCTAKKEF